MPPAELQKTVREAVSLASEYLKWKYRDVEPDKPIVYTPKQKAANWWHYHKWHLVIGAALIICAADIGTRALGIGEVSPDYQIAYVGENPLPEDTVTSLENALAELGSDANGDGRVVVKVNQYASGSGEAQTAAGKDLPAAENNDSAGYAYAAEVTMLADLEDCESYFFLLDKPEEFQRDYQVLRRLDGTLPENGDRDYENCYLSWTDCPTLCSLPLGEYTEEFLGQSASGDSQELLSGLFLARRGFWSEKTSANIASCDALWEAITKGALS